MKQTILDYLDEQIEQGKELLGSIKEANGAATIRGALEAFNEVKEFVEEIEE